MIENLDVAACPSQSQLERLLADDLPAEQRAGVERHVESCLRCQSALARLTEDSLVDRAAHLTRSPGRGLLNLLGAAISTPRAPLSGESHNQGITMITLSCSACQKQLKVKPALAGKKVKCPGCGQVILVPSTADVASPANPDMATLPPDSSKAPSREVQPLADTHPPAGKPDVTRALGQAAPEHDPSLTDFLAPAQAEDELGRLGKYRVLKILGHGGMGVVFRAEDVQLKRSVALKAMLPGMAASASAGKRFLREAQSMAAVEHDHIVRIYQVDEDRGVPFLAMEFLKGEPLDERLKREDKLPLPDVLRIGREIAEALAAAHSHGLIHRDVKPANIWLEAPRNRVKILDFGLARAVSEDSGLTQQGAIIGTPAYMAPEQGRGDPIDARTDLFSLGVVLYRLVSGRQPFLGKDTVSTLLEVATVQPAAPSQLNANVPKELSELVMKLLEKDPARRPASASEVVDILKSLERKFAREEDAHDKTESLPAAPKVKTSPSSRKKLPVLIGSLLLAMAAAIGLWAAGVIRFSSEQGDLVLETDDPDFVFAVAKGGGILLEDRKTKRTFHVKAVPQGKNEYELEITDAGADLAFKTRTFTVKRGDRVALKAWFERKKDGIQVAANKDRYVLEFADAAFGAEIPTLKFDKSGPFTLEATISLGKKPAGGGALVGQPDGPRMNFFSFNHLAFFLPGIKNYIEGGSFFTEKPSKHACVYTGAHALTFQDGKLLGRVAVDGVQWQLVKKNFVIGAGFKGRIYDVRISNVARYEQDYDATKPLTADKDTLAMYYCNEATGNVLKDSSGNGHDGKIINGKFVKLEQASPTGPIPESWFKEVAGLSPQKQVEAVLAKLKERNPGFDGKFGGGFDPRNFTRIEQGAVTAVTLWGKDIIDLSPLRALPLKHLEIPGTKVSDLTPLKGMPLTVLVAWATPIADLSPLRGMALTSLAVSGAKVTDLSPLQGMPLTHLAVNGTNVSDLSPLKGMKLETLNCEQTGIKDFSPLQGMPLVSLDASVDMNRDAALLRSLPKLEKINNKLARGVALQLWLDGSKGTVPSLKTDAAGDLTIETVFTHLGHNEGTIVGTPNFHLRIRADHLGVAFNSRKLNTMLVSPEPSTLCRVHMAAVKSADSLRFFVNGKLIRKQDLTEPVSLDATEPFIMGGWSNIWLHEVRFSKSARYREDFTPQHRFEPDADTLALYHCDDGEGNVLKDSSGNKHDAQLEKARWMRGVLEAPKLKPVPDAWVKQVTALPAEKQLAEVLARLQDRNSDFDGKAFHKITDGAVTELWLSTPGIVDIDPVRALTRLQVFRAGPAVTDLSPLKGLPLKEIACEFRPERDAAILRSIKTLEKINGKAAAEFWRQVDAAGKPIEPAWFKQVAALPAEKQVEAVVEKLKERNPGYDGKVHPKIEGGIVTELIVPGKAVADISPLQAVSGLRVLFCDYTVVSDLSPLKNLPLTSLSFYHSRIKDLSPLKNVPLKKLSLDHPMVNDLSPLRGMQMTHLEVSFSPVTDLSPLRDMPLTLLNCNHTGVSDLSPLKGMPLVELHCGGTKVSDLLPLKGI